MIRSGSTPPHTHPLRWRLLLFAAKGVSMVLFLFLRYGLRYRYATIVANLTNAFPGRSASDCQQLTRAYYHHISDLCVEPFLFFYASAGHRAQLAQFANLKLLTALHRAHRPVILLASHYGNWEYLASLPQQVAYPVYSAYSPLKNRWLNRLFVHLRSHLGVSLIPKSTFFRQALSVLKQPDDRPLLLLLADQRPGPGNAKYHLPFLHQETAVQLGAERMAVLSNAAVVTIEAHQTARFQYQFTCRLLCEQAALMAPLAITRQYYQALERMITRAPAYWLWSHNQPVERPGAAAGPAVGVVAGGPVSSTQRAGQPFWQGLFYPLFTDEALRQYPRSGLHDPALLPIRHLLSPADPRRARPAFYLPDHPHQL